VSPLPPSPRPMACAETLPKFLLRTRQLCFSRTALGVPVMAPSSRTTASWARSPGAATQSAFSSRQAIASLSGAIPQGPRLPLLAPTAPRDGVTSAPSQLEQQAVGPRVESVDQSTASGFVTLSQQELAEVLRAAFTSVQAVAPHVRRPICRPPWRRHCKVLHLLLPLAQLHLWCQMMSCFRQKVLRCLPSVARAKGEKGRVMMHHHCALAGL
jgi:hypothetical protein